MKPLSVLLVAVMMWIAGVGEQAMGMPEKRRCSSWVEASLVTPQILVSILTSRYPEVEDWETMWAMYSEEENGDKLFEIAAAHLLLETKDLQSLQGIKTEARAILFEAQGLKEVYGSDHVVAVLPLYLVLNALDLSRPTVGAGYPLNWLRARVAARFSSQWKPSAVKAEPEEHDTGSETARSKLFGNNGIKKHNVRPLRSEDVRVVSPASE